MITSEKKNDLLKAISYIKSKETVTYNKVKMKDLMISEKITMMKIKTEIIM